MKQLKYILLFLFCANIYAQKNYPLIIKDSLRDVLIDDYKSVYLYKNSDLTIVKYDTLGIKKSEIRFPQPYKIQSVENPLNIFLFSENAQEIKILDQNLNLIQNINLANKFLHIKAAFSEDLQFAWLLDSSKNKVIQYNYREDKIINSFPFRINFDDTIDFLVDQKYIYILKNKSFLVYDFYGEQIYAIDIESGRKLRIEQNKVLIFEKNSISEFTKDLEFLPIFSKENTKIVDKNHSHFLALIDDKLYLYKIEK